MMNRIKKWLLKKLFNIEPLPAETILYVDAGTGRGLSNFNFIRTVRKHYTLEEIIDYVEFLQKTYDIKRIIIDDYGSGQILLKQLRHVHGIEMVTRMNKKDQFDCTNVYRRLFR